MAKTDLVKVTVFVTVPDPETVGIYRKARDQWMEGHAPAATYLVVAGLAHRDYLVEIEAIAAARLNKKKPPRTEAFSCSRLAPTAFCQSMDW